LLGSEDVRVARTAAGSLAQDRELDGVGGVVSDEVGDTRLSHGVEPRHERAVEDVAVLDQLVVAAVTEDDVERDLVYASVLAAHGLGQLGEAAGRPTDRGSGRPAPWRRVAAHRATSASADEPTGS